MQELGFPLSVPALDPEITLLDIVVFGVLAGVLLRAGLRMGLGLLGLELLDLLRWNGALRNSPNFRAFSLVLPEDILSCHVNCRTSIVNSAGYLYTYLEDM